MKGRRKRSKPELLLEFLSFCRNERASTHIMYGVNTSYEVEHKYLEACTRAGLLDVREDGNKKKYKTNESGKKVLELGESFMKQIKEVLEYLRED
jgi:predicted transcriptional regulator